MCGLWLFVLLYVCFGVVCCCLLSYCGCLVFFFLFDVDDASYLVNCFEWLFGWCLFGLLCFCSRLGCLIYAVAACLCCFVVAFACMFVCVAYLLIDVDVYVMAEFVALCVYDIDFFLISRVIGWFYVDFD